MAMECEKHRQGGNEVYWLSSNYNNSWVNHTRTYWIKQKWDKVIQEPENLPFLTLPRPDRVFTRAKEYTSGNYKFLPGTHILSASGCWHGACSFCVEQGKSYEVRPVEDVISEIEECKTLGFREIFDDSATFPVGNWADSFWGGLIGHKNKIPIGCNMRIINADFRQMKAGSCRMLLFGIESANQATLDRIQKGVKVEEIIPTIRKASEAGLEPHLACMFGYPWETDKEAINTLKLIHYLLRKGFAKTAQASFYTPPKEYEKGNEKHRRYVNQIYNVAIYPEFWFNKLREINNLDDLKYLWLQIKKGLKR